MNGTPAGWYQDPDHSERQRYWDGGQWTKHVGTPATTTAAPAGWHPDPDVRGQVRYWDGAAWTDQVQLVPLFDGPVTLPSMVRRKEQHLLVTTEEVVWGDDRIRWSDVTSHRQLITTQNGLTTYEIWLNHRDVSSWLVFGPGHVKNRAPRVAYDTIIDQLRRTLGVRVIKGLLQMVAQGEAVRLSGLIFSPEGFGKEATGQLVPWTEYAGIEVGGYESIFVQLFRAQGGKRKKVLRVPVDQQRAWAIPPVVEAHVRRYARGDGTMSATAR